jgi:hypothetical protein
LPTGLGALGVDTDAVLFLVWPLVVQPGFRAISRWLQQQPMMSLGGVGRFVNLHSQRSHCFSPFIADRFERTLFTLLTTMVFFALLCMLCIFETASQKFA